MMTPWFPSSIKPVHAGVYEVRTPNNEANKYCYYDHLGWRLCAGSIYRAEQRKHYKTEPLSPSMELVDSQWRGLRRNKHDKLSSLLRVLQTPCVHVIN